MLRFTRGDLLEAPVEALVKAVNEVGVMGKGLALQFRDVDPAIGTTTPDVLYRGADHGDDEGVCIYLDGLSGHLHGNAATAEQDRRIRSWLRNNGYEVIEIAATDLADKEAMRRHFVKLAGYLGDRALREKIKADSSWFQEGGDVVAERSVPKLEIVQPRPEDRYVTCVPLVPIEAAAGQFGEPQSLVDENWAEWVEVANRKKLRPGMFVARVVGESMEPQIPDGSYCLFVAPVEGSRQGRTVLVRLFDSVDPETGQRYTVKRYEREKVETEEGWRHVRVTLLPKNRDFKPIVIEGNEDERVQVVAEFVDVVGE